MVAETSLHLAKVPCQPCNLSMFQNGERYNSNNAHFGEAVKHQLDMESLFYQPLAVVFREFLVLQAFNKSPVCFERIPLNNSKMSILKQFYEASERFFCISSNKISGTTWAMNGFPSTGAWAIPPLGPRYGVDLVFNGHVHSYERSFPVYNNSVNECSWEVTQRGGWGKRFERKTGGFNGVSWFP